MNDITVKSYNRDKANEIFGNVGRRLWASKQVPLDRKDHILYWNACIFDKDANQIWYGDLDVTKSEDQLKKLAETIGKIYVTPEFPWRFDGFKATIKTYKDGVIEFIPKSAWPTDESIHLAYGVDDGLDHSDLDTDRGSLRDAFLADPIIKTAVEYARIASNPHSMNTVGQIQRVGCAVHDAVKAAGLLGEEKS